MSVKLYVGNISYSTTKQDLYDLFSAVGSVRSSSIVEDRQTGRSRGFGFVVMSSKAEAENAVAQLDGKEVGGRRLTVSESKSGGVLTSGGSLNMARSRDEVFVGYPTRAYSKQPTDMFGW
jgi:RNA recognition motif-containing protein